MSKEKSLNRSKKSTITIADILVKEGVAIIPGGGLMYEAAKALLNHGKEYISDRNDKRLDRFHNVIISKAEGSEQYDNLFDSEFEADDYHAILSSCLQDIEDQKTDTYARLLKSFILEKTNEAERQLFIQSVKTLSMLDIRLLRKIYINSKHDLMSPGGTEQQLKTLLNTHNQMDKISLSRFSYLGLIDNDKNTLTDLGQQFVQRVSGKEELSPEAIGRKAWTGLSIAIICYEISNKEHSRFYTPTSDILHEKKIKSMTFAVDNNKTPALIFYQAGILLVGDMEIKDSQLETLIKFSTNHPLARLNITKKGEMQNLESVTFCVTYSALDCVRGEEHVYLNSIIDDLFAA